MKHMNPTHLRNLKNALEAMVTQNRINNNQMIEMLGHAGLSKIINSDKWVDGAGNVYTF